MGDKKYISREDIFPNGLFIVNVNDPQASLDELINHIRSLPAADVVEVRHGKWSKRGNEKTCSECAFIYYSNNDDWNYCPNCGAKMYGKGEG